MLWHRQHESTQPVIPVWTPGNRKGPRSLTWIHCMNLILPDCMIHRIKNHRNQMIIKISELISCSWYAYSRYFNWVFISIWLLFLFVVWSFVCSCSVGFHDSCALLLFPLIFDKVLYVPIRYKLCCSIQSLLTYLSMYLTIWKHKDY